jgi:hypothetical protein
MHNFQSSLIGCNANTISFHLFSCVSYLTKKIITLYHLVHVMQGKYCYPPK